MKILQNQLLWKKKKNFSFFEFLHSPSCSIKVVEVKTFHFLLSIMSNYDFSFFFFFFLHFCALWSQWVINVANSLPSNFMVATKVYLLDLMQASLSWLKVHIFGGILSEYKPVSSLVCTLHFPIFSERSFFFKFDIKLFYCLWFINWVIFFVPFSI